MEEKVINNLSCREITNVKKVYYIWYDNYLSIEKIKREELWRINKLNLKPDILPMLFNVDVDEWNWDESGDKTSNGGLFERQLKGFVPKLNEWAESYFNEMLRRPMCIFIETFDESVYLFGGESPRTTVTFTKSISNRNGYDLVFTCLSEESSLIINDEAFFPAEPLPPTGEAEVERRHEWDDPYSYCGTAPNASSESALAWTIIRIEVFLDGTTDLKTAFGAWTDRAILIYT